MEEEDMVDVEVFDNQNGNPRIAHLRYCREYSIWYWKP